jgi:hypothetical protein
MGSPQDRDSQAQATRMLRRDKRKNDGHFPTALTDATSQRDTLMDGGAGPPLLFLPGYSPKRVW